MKLLLTSSGINNSELEKAFGDLTENKRRLKIALIPTAGDPINWVQHKNPPMDSTPEIDETRLEKNNQWQAEWKREHEEKGFDVALVDLKEGAEKIEEELSKVDVIKFCGGDGNWLLNWVRKSKLDSYLKNLLEKGIVFVGESAGSNLVTPSFGLGWWTPEWKEDHSGLGIVNFCLAVHQNDNDERTAEANILKNREKIREFIDFPWKVYLLKDGQAIKVDGDKIEHIGPGIKKSV